MKKVKEIDELLSQLDKSISQLDESSRVFSLFES